MTAGDYDRIQLTSMHINEMEEQEFLPGDVVSHREWGIGYVLEVGSGPEPDLIVEFTGKPRHRMSSQLASHALSKLPADGLEALLLKERDKVATWSKDAPLKLIGAALADLGKAAKPADLRAKLDSRRLLPVKWESWWKRVQPAIKDSPCFFVRSDGSYHLASAVEQIPESPLPPSPKKAKAARLTSAQVQEITVRLEAGEIEFESLKGTKTLRLVAKELVQRSLTSEMARSVAMKALQGPVLHTRVILEEFSHLGQLSYLIEALVRFTSHIQLLAATPALKEGKKIGEHVMAKLHLMENATRQLVEYGQLQEAPSVIASLVHALLQLALVVWRKEMSSWRSQSLDRVSNTVVILAQRQPKVFSIAGEYLARHEGNILGKVAVADSLLTKVAADVRYEAVDQLLIGSLVEPSGFVEECFLHHVKEEQQLSWISSALSHLLLSCNIRAVEALARLLLRKSPRLEAHESKMYVELAIALASVSPQAPEVLSAVIRDRLKQRLDSVTSEISDLTRPAKPKTVLDLIEDASHAKVEEERRHAREMCAALEADLKDLQLALETTKSKSIKLEEMVEQLKSSYRLPERWALFQGKKEILESLVGLYQEAFLAKGAGGDPKATGWVLQRLQNLLQKHSVSEFGRVDSRATYDPTLHEFIPGFEDTGEEVRIKCPGFEWLDPAGNKIILARAKVVRC